MNGFFLLHRGWMDSFRPEPFTEREAFLWSIERAAYQAHEQWFNGHRITVDRGEFVTSLREMEKAFDWSLKRIRGFMDRMVKAQKWAQRRAYEGAQSPTIVTVCNYITYQSIAVNSGTVEGTAKGTRGAQSGHSEGTQHKEGKKGKKVEESPSDSSIGKPIATVSLLPVIDEIEPAFRAYEALRADFVPGARPLTLSKPRRTAMNARLREIGGPAAWDEVLARIRGSPFLRGETERFPFAEIDWLLKPANLLKVREGNYNDRSGHHAARGSAPQSTIAALHIARARNGIGRS